jgi:hypothetical protein
MDRTGSIEAQRADEPARVETPRVESAKLEPVRTEPKVEPAKTDVAPELRRSTE